MRITSFTVLLLLALALNAGAHSEGYPVDPKPIRVGGGRPGGVPTLPAGGTTSPGAGIGAGGPAFDWAFWWRLNRETLIDFPALRRARRFRAGLPVKLAPGVRDRALAELRAAAAEPSEPVSDAACIALGRARDPLAVPLLLAGARRGKPAALIGLGLLPPSKETRDALLGRLTSASSAPRPQAMAALAIGLSGDLAGLPVLVGMATSPTESATVAEACLVGIGALQSDAAARDILNLLALPSGSTGRPVRRAALSAFACGRTKAKVASTALRRALRHPAVPFRRQAALSLGAIAAPGSAAARDLGVITTGHPEPTVRATAALGLSRVASPDSLGPLRLALRQDAMDLRAVAALGLARWDPREAAPLLSDALASNHKPSVRGALAASLGLARRPAVIPKLRPLLTEFGPAEVRGHAALALAILGDGPSRESIRPLLYPPTPVGVRIDAALAAGLLGDPDAEKDVARRLFEEESEQGRAAAALALGYLGSPDAIPVLVRILRDRGNPEAVRTLAAASLGRLLDARSQSPATRLAAGMDPSLPSALLREVLSWF